MTTEVTEAVRRMRMIYTELSQDYSQMVRVSGIEQYNHRDPYGGETVETTAYKRIFEHQLSEREIARIDYNLRNNQNNKFRNIFNIARARSR